MQVFSRRFLQVGVLVFLTLALALSAQAASFSNASLKGSYSFLTNLRTANVNTPQFAAVGVMTFDGAGNVTGSYTSISDHAVQSGALGGTYVVKSNGTGTLNLTTGLTAQFAITLNSTVGWGGSGSAIAADRRHQQRRSSAAPRCCSPPPRENTPWRV